MKQNPKRFKDIIDQGFFYMIFDRLDRLWYGSSSKVVQVSDIPDTCI